MAAAKRITDRIAAHRGPLSFIGRLAVTVVVLGILATRIDIAEVGQRLSRFGGLVAASLALMFALQIALASLRWFLVLRAESYPIPYARILGVWLEANFVGQVLPAAVGTDAIRIAKAIQLGVSAKASIASVVVDRIVGLTGLVILGLTAVLASSATAGAAALVVLVVGVALLVAVRWVGAGFKPGVSSLPGARWLNEIARPVIGPRMGRFAAAMLVVSVGVHLISVFQFQLIGTAYGLSLRTTDYLLLIPPVMFAQALPVSLGGWGVREGAMVLTLATAGVSTNDALAVSLTYGLSVLAVSFVGAIPLILGRTRKSV